MHPLHYTDGKTRPNALVRLNAFDDPVIKQSEEDTENTGLKFAATFSTELEASGTINYTTEGSLPAGIFNRSTF